jgi:hypothetical protein
MHSLPRAVNASVGVDALVVIFAFDFIIIVIAIAIIIGFLIILGIWSILVPMP